MKTQEEKKELAIHALKSCMEMLEEMLRTVATNDQADAIDSVLTHAHATIMQCEY
jgi:Holliday junction resolvasome RuvABC endonuclease subunit